MNYTGITFNDENMAQVMQSPASSKKRKRTAADNTANVIKRSSLSHTNGNGDHVNGHGEVYSESTANDFGARLQAANAEYDISTTAAAALSAHLSAPDQSLSFVSTGSGTDGRHLDESFGMVDTQHQQVSYSGLSQYTAPAGPIDAGREAPSSNGQKPAVGTDEWNKVRRDNHKEVERRRRETINEGINELAKIVPNCEKNKGSILARAVTYISDLKAQIDGTSNKKILEKVVMEQAIQELMSRNEELTSRNEDMRAQLVRVVHENESLRKQLGSEEIGDGDGSDGDGGGGE